MKKKMITMLISVGIFFGLVFGWWGLRHILIANFISHMAESPQTVATAEVKQQNWQPYLNSVGTLTAVNGVDVTSEVSGLVSNISFTSGQMVKQGDLLVKLDSKVEEATLQNLTAQLHLNQIDVNRQAILYRTKSVSKSVLDASQATLEETQANVTKANAQIALKNITAPFSGKLGIRQVNVGQYIAPGNPLVSLQSLDPLYVDFSLPEQNLPALSTGQTIQVTNSATSQTITGKIIAISPKVDLNTRNIQIRAVITNKNLSLLPGMSVNVDVFEQQQTAVIVIPQTAITFSLYGDSVYLVVKGKDAKGKDNLQVQRKFVTVGERRGNQAVILKGLKKGDQVVTGGQLKLDNGTPVTINNSVVL